MESKILDSKKTFQLSPYTLARFCYFMKGFFQINQSFDKGLLLLKPSVLIWEKTQYPFESDDYLKEIRTAISEQYDSLLKVKEGLPLHQVMKESGLFPDLFCSLIGDAQYNNEWADVLEKLETFFDKYGEMK